MSNRDRAWDELRRHVTELETLEGISGLLGWDEQTGMPARASALRGRQQALLSRLVHERVADPRLGRWLDALDGSEDPVQRACLRNLRRDHERARRVPADLVEALAHARSEGFAAWIEAKREADFGRFAPALRRLVELARRRAEAIAPDRPPYEVLLEDFDPGLDVGDLREMLARLRAGVAPLLAALDDRPTLPRLGGHFDLARQARLNREVAEALGYDFDAGRLDHAEHPFTSGHGPGDVRITTHLVEDDLLLGLSGTIHEVGHGLYEQGLPELAGTTVARAASYGLHESQSRLWENAVGRSRPFCAWLAERIRHHFPDADVDADRLYAASNRFVRGLVRTEADEVTYDLHIAVRFELELALFEGRLAVDALPEAWREAYTATLGATPSDDREGVLQDVHWSAAAFGYFPSYSLGNLWAASLVRSLEAAEPGVWDGVARGRFAPIRAFLRERIHHRGHLLEAPALIREAIGERDPVADLVDHLWSRHGALHGVARPADDA